MAVLDRLGTEAKDKILAGKKEFLSLDFSDPKDREIAYACLEARPQLYVLSLDAGDENQREVLARWVNAKYSNIILLKEEQRHSELIDIYLFKKISESEGYKKNKMLTLFKSYEHKLSITFNYKTKEGETICYYDNKLRLPLKIMTSAVVRFRVVDSLALVKAIDVELSVIDLNLLVATLNTVVNSCVRKAIFDTIDEYSLDYFELSKYYREMDEKIKATLAIDLRKYGLEVAEANIVGITIPERTSAKIEGQCFAIAEEERVKDYENRMEEISLKHYERKAEIHSKYPDFPVTLTETEKDLALNRYLKRNGVEKTYTAIDTPKPEERVDPGRGSETKLEVTEPEPPKKPKYANALAIYISLLCVGILAGGLTMIASVSAGLIVLGVVVLGFGLYAAINWNKIKDAQNGKKEYKKLEDEYKKELMAYQNRANK